MIKRLGTTRKWPMILHCFVLYCIQFGMNRIGLMALNLIVKNCIVLFLTCNRTDSLMQTKFVKFAADIFYFQTFSFAEMQLLVFLMVVLFATPCAGM